MINYYYTTYSYSDIMSKQEVLYHKILPRNHKNYSLIFDDKMMSMICNLLPLTSMLSIYLNKENKSGSLHHQRKGLLDIHNIHLKLDYGLADNYHNLNYLNKLSKNSGISNK